MGASLLDKIEEVEFEGDDRSFELEYQMALEKGSSSIGRGRSEIVDLNRELEGGAHSLDEHNELHSNSKTKLQLREKSAVRLSSTHKL
mmetsp:Transcript_52443/g.114750  ORF Transcript_52443/g.114750 Transcript_52443/m.114750 type:complete len:88 (-) Transcript_52443:268-531(-)